MVFSSSYNFVFFKRNVKKLGRVLSGNEKLMKNKFYFVHLVCPSFMSRRSNGSTWLFGTKTVLKKSDMLIFMILLKNSSYIFSRDHNISEFIFHPKLIMPLVFGLPSVRFNMGNPQNVAFVTYKGRNEAIVKLVIPNCCWPGKLLMNGKQSLSPEVTLTSG